VIIRPVRNVENMHEIETKDIQTYIESFNEFLPVPTMVVNEVELSEIVFLHVHHQYYILANLPWEYPDSALITVCSNCHEVIHKSGVIPVYREETKAVKLNLIPCSRCYGQGILPQFSHHQNGICFKCGGAKYLELHRDIDVLPEGTTPMP
jgi:hypothetical protein